ncbi:neuropeptides capa receptor-like [Amphiura filiformis]|uniref:neuropeptides capa receptor-like n=1 Tax=Amphiura filiformis TaxID=82378 RepID=UPI003B21C344
METNDSSEYGDLNFQVRDSDLECYNKLSNETPIDDPIGYTYRRGEVFLILIAWPLILILGVVGNTAFIYVVFRVERMRTITNRYLANLAVSDVIFLVAAIGSKLVKYASSPFDQDDTYLGAAGCICLYFFTDLSYFASLFFITLTSLDRYVALCRPLDRNSAVNRKSKSLIIVSWIISCAFAASLTPANGNIEAYCHKWPNEKPYNHWPLTIRYCNAVYKWVSSFSTGLQTVPFFVTLIVNSVLYLSIIRELNRSMDFRYGRQQLSISMEQKCRDFRARNQVVKMLVVNGVIFFVCLSPFELMSFSLMVAISNNNRLLIANGDVRRCLFLFARILSYINSAINPLIYTGMCKPYKDAFREAFCGKVKRKRPLVVRTSTLQETDVTGM